MTVLAVDRLADNDMGLVTVRLYKSGAGGSRTSGIGGDRRQNGRGATWISTGEHVRLQTRPNYS